MVCYAHQRRLGTIRPVTLTHPAIDRPGRPGWTPGTTGYRTVVVVLALAGMANFMLLYYVQPMLPIIADQYGVSAGSSAQVLAVSTLGMAAILMVTGPLSDVAGRVALMRWSLLLAGLLGLASAFAVTWPVLLVTRAVEGAALGVLPAVALAYLREEVDASAHLRANATYIAGTAVGGTAARFLPGPLNELLGWSGTTVVFSALTVGSALAVWAWLPAARNFTRIRFDLTEAVDQTWRALRDPVIVSWCVVGGCSMGAFVGVYNAMAFRIHAAGFAEGSSVYMYLAFSVGIVAPGLARPVAGRAGRPVTVLAALGLLAIGMMITRGSNWPTIIGGLGVLTFAFFVIHSLATGGTVARAHAVGLGVARASSGYLVSYYVGGAVLGVAATHIWSVKGWAALVVVLLSVIAVAAVAAGRILVSKRRPRPSEGNS